MRTITIHTQPSRGVASVLDNNTYGARIRWVDNSTGAGSTSFTYSANGSNVATCNLTIGALELPVFAERGTTDTRTAPANNLTPAFPVTGLAAGDLFLAHVIVHADAGSQSVTTPSGWTLVASRSDGVLFSAVFSKTALGSESGTQAFVWNATNTGGVRVAYSSIYRWRPHTSGSELYLDAPTTAAGSGATATMPTVLMGGVNRRAIAFGAFNVNANANNAPTGEVGGDWIRRSGASVGSGGASTQGYDAAMPLGGAINGGTVAQTGATRWNVIAFGVQEAPPISGLYISTTGDDATGDGSFALPWATLAKGMAETPSGGRLNLRGGRYSISSTFNWTRGGSSSAPVVVASFPGEMATLDFGIAYFQTPGVGAWTLHDAGTQTYKSASGSYTGTSGSWTASIVINGQIMRLLPHWSLASLMSETYVWDSGQTYYGGPGFVRHSDGFMYIRIQSLASPRDAGVPAAAPAGHAVRNTPASDFDPNNYVCHFSPVADTFNVSSSNVRFERIAWLGGDRGPRLTGVSDITFQNCKMHGQRICVRLEANNTNVQVLGCDIDGALPPYLSWNDVKAGGGHWQNFKISAFTIEDNNDDILVQDCRIANIFDIMATLRNTSDNVRFLHCTVPFLFDDFIQGNAGATNVEIGYCYIIGPCFGYNGGINGDGQARKFFHHNIIDVRRDEWGWREGMAGANGGGTSWRESHAPFPTHSSGGAIQPARIYNNTILYGLNINLQGARIQRVGDKTAGLHSVFNNIVIGYSAHSYVRGVTIGSSDQEIDFNVIHNVGAYTTGTAFREWPDGSGGTAHFTNLSAWLASAGFTESQTVYAPGFEANSVQADPLLADPDAGDYRPSAAGPAASGAKDLSGTNWPGTSTATAWFGAVDPDSPDPLGGIGARGVPGP